MSHPCTTDPSLEGCAELAAQHTQAAAEEAATTAVETVQETLAANAPKIMEHLDTALLKIGDWVEAAESFGGDQVPLLVREIIYFEIASQGFLTALGILGVLWGIYSFRWSLRRAEARLERIKEHTRILKEERSNRGESHSATDDAVFCLAHYGVPISGGVLGVIGFLMFVANFMDFLKPIVAPRLFLIEYLRELVK